MTLLRANTEEKHRPKRRMRKTPKLPSKKPRLLQNIQIPPYPTQPVLEASAVFENVQQPHSKKIELRIPDAITQENTEQIKDQG